MLVYRRTEASGPLAAMLTTEHGVSAIRGLRTRVSRCHVPTGEHDVIPRSDQSRTGQKASRTTSRHQGRYQHKGSDRETSSGGQ